ncbi:uncharacterized protein LOC111580423 isoform X3 [Amphiprion ocellaris]|uniref:uncharacterized protein LOC111580423 isoform X3 n=1 Tax=Amphiprion ocellaris TaxID=80972 RepID=UPI002410E7B5|nr:uncharacterized protein LOC111580423 isoform X3 [Amphiprion ocellaris]
MFPSFGLFSDINCPLAQRGQCKRPHCLYKHAAEARYAFGASSTLVFAGVRNGCLFTACGAPVNDETGDCLHELEQINKEIETVRHEVEQEQRRLSHYQTVQADGRNSASIYKYETAGKNVDRGLNGLLSCSGFTKTHAKARKYVVDNSKPRTDLEYDPLSNFSADLGTCSSSGKDQKSQQGLKKARISVSCDRKEPAKFQVLLSRSQSTELHDDSNEDSVLIIDVPPSPDEKRGQTQKPIVSVAGRFSQDAVGEVMEAETVPILSDTSLKVTSPSTSRVDTNKVQNYCDVKNSQDLPTCIDNEGLEKTPIDGNVVDLSGCLKALNNECQKIIGFQSTETLVEKIHDPVSLLATSDKQNHSWNNPWCELPNNVEKINQLQPPKNSLFYKAPADNSSQTQHSKQAQTTKQQALTRVHNQWPPEQSSVVMSGKMQGKAATASVVSVGYEEQAESPSGSNTHVTNRAGSSYETTEQLLVKADCEEIIIISSDDEADELNYSEMELSDSDPMEECYRIFMEANNEEKGNEAQPDIPIGAMDVVKPEVNTPPQTLRGKKRVAHEAKPTEPVAKSRPQPQVLVPLRGPAASGFGSRPSITSKLQQVQQRASMLSASVKGGQAFVSSTCQNKPETQSAPSALTQTPGNLQPALIQNAYLNYIPVGTAVEVGDNLHLILPEGAFPLPVASSSSPVTTVLTPISQMHQSAFTVKQTYHPPIVTPVQRYCSTAPVLIPPPVRKSSLTSAFASTSLQSSPASCTVPQASVQAVIKPISTKRKLKQQQCEAAKEKVPHDVRQRYVSLFTEEFLKTTGNANDAFEKALSEERTVYNRSMNKLKYLSIAVNALKKMKNQSAVAAKGENEVNSQRLKGNIPLNLKKFKANADDMALYESLKDYILTYEKLTEGNYPVQHPERHGCAIVFIENKRVHADPLKRICCRCGATYSVSQTGKHIRKEECNYHYGKAVKNRVPGGVETRYSCCEGVMGTPGCQMFKLHVHDSLSLDGFVSTLSRCPSDTGCPGIYSLDCEKCYTIHGLELSRVTVVNSSLQVVYDTFVRPDNEVIDYNTRFSGISEEDVKGNHTSLREVQETLLSFINADTILIGHGLETDLCLLKLLHGTVVDTSVIFPHRLGPPHKLTLNSLTAEYLRRIIQESGGLWPRHCRRRCCLHGAHAVEGQRRWKNEKMPAIKPVSAVHT